ncbi:MAG: CDP-archaeol synthase, partial [Candidatus Hodarchaeales archaeon]
IDYPVAFTTLLEQGLLYNLLEPIGIIFWTNEVILSLLIGFLLGFGSLLGDLIGSFIKRRRGLQRGESFLFMDQLGFLLTALILVWPIIPWNVFWLIILVPLTLGLHIILNLFSHVIGLQKAKL